MNQWFLVTIFSFFLGAGSVVFVSNFTGKVVCKIWGCTTKEEKEISRLLTEQGLYLEKIENIEKEKFVLLKDLEALNNEQLMIHKQVKVHLNNIEELNSDANNALQNFDKIITEIDRVATYFECLTSDQQQPGSCAKFQLGGAGF